jgi:hypothetical protein
MVVLVTERSLDTREGTVNWNNVSVVWKGEIKWSWRNKARRRGPTMRRDFLCTYEMGMSIYYAVASQATNTQILQNHSSSKPHLHTRFT